MAAGDMISIVCHWGMIPFRHYGIDIGDGTVVHLATDLSDPATRTMSVQRVPYEEFHQGKKVRVESIDSPLAPQTIVQRALSAVGQLGYHILHDNCEHFARHCVHGESTSIQVERVARSTVRVSMLGLVGCSAYRVLARSAAASTLPLAWLRLSTIAPVVAGEAARGGSYAIARALNLRHHQAVRVGQSAGAVASAASGLVVGGPACSISSLIMFVAVEQASGEVARRIIIKRRSPPRSVG